MRTRLFCGSAPTRFESATNSNPFPKAIPLAPPRTVGVAVLSSGPGVWAVNVGCPTTDRAAWPVKKSAPHATPAARRIRAQDFMLMRAGQVKFQYTKDTGRA